MDFTIMELRQLLKYCTNDRNSTRVNTEHFKFVTKLMDKLRSKFKNLDIQDVSISFKDLKEMSYTELSEQYGTIRTRLKEIDKELKLRDIRLGTTTKDIEKYKP